MSLALRSDRLRVLLPRTLTARLVVTAVALVAVVGILVAASATIAMRSYLTDKRDGELAQALRGPQLGAPPSADGDGGRIYFRPGALTVTVLAGSNTAAAATMSDTGVVHQLTLATVRKLISTTSDGKPHTVSVNGERYRVMADTDGSGDLRIVGLPTSDIDSTLNSMMRWFALLTLLGVGVAGMLGALLVRRQMRPLYAVAETARAVSTQELSTGETAIETRVPEELTDEASEVGQVGSALNTLLDHIDDALAARHRSEQQVRQFVADASHELRTPLATIHGYAELSRRQLTGAGADDTAALLLALGKVETETDRMADLVADLLLLARLDSGRPLARQQVDLTRLLLEAVADARVVAPDHKWQLALPEEPVTVVGDDARLHQVITNLLNNARSHTPAGTTVTVSAQSAADTVTIEVHDDGPGLPADLVDEAFDRFTRGDSSRTRASGGAGLGLSLVSAIAEAHGGHASVTSRRGDTTFSVTLPRG